MEGGHAKISFGCEARGIWLRRLHESERGRVCSQKGRWIAGRHSSHELEELLARSSWKTVCRMIYDVRVDVISECNRIASSRGFRTEALSGIDSYASKLFRVTRRTRVDRERTSHPVGTGFRVSSFTIFCRNPAPPVPPATARRWRSGFSPQNRIG